MNSSKYVINVEFDGRLKQCWICQKMISKQARKLSTKSTQQELNTKIILVNISNIQHNKQQ